MDVQIYKHREEPGFSSLPSTTLLKGTKLGELLTYTDKLGLQGQRQVIIAEQQGYQALTTTRAKLLRNIFPCHYSLFKEQNTRFSAKYYLFDVIPTQAMQEIDRAKPFFDDIQVWTPEKISDPDPIAVGVIYGPRNAQNLYYPVVRWGQALLPFNKMLIRHYRNKVLLGLCLVGLLGYGAYKYTRPFNFTIHGKVTYQRLYSNRCDYEDGTHNAPCPTTNNYLFN